MIQEVVMATIVALVTWLILIGFVVVLFNIGQWIAPKSKKLQDTVIWAGLSMISLLVLHSLSMPTGG